MHKGEIGGTVKQQNASQHKYSVKSLEKGLLVLELMTAKRREVSLTEVAQELNLGKGTVHRIVSTLRGREFVNQNPETKKYGLGLRVFEMGSAMTKEEFLKKVMKPELLALSGECKETVSASLMENGEIRYIARLDSEQVLRVSIREGTRFPAHCTASGKVLLAALSNEELKEIYQGSDRLITLTENSISSFRKLKEVISEVRMKDIAYDYEEALIGVYCVAAPIKNSKNQTIATVSISGPKERMTAKRMKKLSSMLIESTRKISRKISGDENSNSV
jgi:DNA-binding IclR family transcriptional regulator